MAKLDFPIYPTRRIIPGYRVTPRSIYGIEYSAVSFLNMVGKEFEIGHFYEFDLHRIHYALRVSESLTDEAVTVFSTREIVVSKDVYETISAPRNRFTLGHELGHAILHTDELSMREGAAARPMNVVSLKAFESSEWQANQFAGAILMPLASIRNNIRLLLNGEITETECEEYITANFLVSSECAERRIKTAKKLVAANDDRILLCERRLR